jgi:hypothetical protein
MSAAWFLLTAASAAAMPEVRYVVKVETNTWQPIALADVEVMLEAKALAPLAQSGTMRLTRSELSSVGSGDYSLIVNGRFVEEAEKFSVYLSFAAGKRQDLPSFHVSETESVGRRSGSEVQRIIEKQADTAASRLVALLTPRLTSGNAPAIEAAPLPWSWGAIEVPEPDQASGSVAMLLDVKQPDHQRHQALAAIKGHVFDQAPARAAVLRCVLRDPSAAIREDCVEALAPVARAHVPTQRLLLHALRTEVDDGVQRSLSKVAATFVGLSRKETLATWLELVASETTSAAGASDLAQQLAREGDVPNLDLAVALCLQQEALVYGKKQACAQWLLPKIPEARRAAVVWRYLEKVRVFEQGEANTFGDVRDHLIGHGSKPIDPRLAELFMQLAERPSAGLARQGALDAVARHPTPTPALIDRLLRVAREPMLTSMALRAARALCRAQPTLTAHTRAGLIAMKSEGPVLRPRFRADPNDEIDKALAAFE